MAPTRGFPKKVGTCGANDPARMPVTTHFGVKVDPSFGDPEFFLVTVRFLKLHGLHEVAELISKDPTNKVQIHKDFCSKDLLLYLLLLIFNISYCSCVESVE